MDSQGSQKLCTTCDQVKDRSAFSLKDRLKGTLHSYCRDCHARWNREHYKRNRATYLATARRNNAIYIAENLRRLVDYLLEHPCLDCGEDDLLVLDFDHRDRSSKRMAVGSLLRYASWAALEVEIAKCDVRCANCHRRRTARQLGWRKLALAATRGQGRPGSNRGPVVLETTALPTELRP
jgi:hypothetical protein